MLIIHRSNSLKGKKITTDISFLYVEDTFVMEKLPSKCRWTFGPTFIFKSSQIECCMRERRYVRAWRAWPSLREFAELLITHCLRRRHVRTRSKGIYSGRHQRDTRGDWISHAARETGDDVRWTNQVGSDLAVSKQVCLSSNMHPFNSARFPA